MIYLYVTLQILPNPDTGWSVYAL